MMEFWCLRFSWRTILQTPLWKQVPPTHGKFGIRPCFHDIRPSPHDSMQVIAERGETQHIDRKNPGENFQPLVFGITKLPTTFGEYQTK